MSLDSLYDDSYKELNNQIRYYEDCLIELIVILSDNKVHHNITEQGILDESDYIFTEALEEMQEDYEDGDLPYSEEEITSLIQAIVLHDDIENQIDQGDDDDITSNIHSN